MSAVLTPKQAARFVGTIEGFTAGVSLEPPAELSIQLLRDGFAVARAQRPVPVISFPEVDRRVNERRAGERRAMADVLARKAGRREGDPLSMWGGL